MMAENSALASSLFLKRALLKNLIPATAIIFLFLVIFKLYGLPIAILVAVLEVTFIVLAERFPIFSVQLLVLAYSVSPKFWASGSEFFIKAEDLIILALVLAAIRKPSIKIKPTPLDNLLFLLFISAVLSTLLGIFYHTIQSPSQSVLSILKMLEYAAGFYFAFYTIKSQKDAESVSYSFLFSALVISAFGFVEWLATYTPIVREYPFRIFDNSIHKGDSNHIAGFLMIAALVCACLLARRKNMPRLIAALLIMLSGLFLTLSREALFSLFIAIVLMTLLFRKSLIALFLVAITFGALLFYSPLGKRISSISWEMEQFQHTIARTEVGYSPDFSYTRNRFENWSIALAEWRPFWLFGSGVGSRHRVFYENQYIMTLAETGLVGLTLFLILVAFTIRTLSKTPSSYLSVGAVCAIAGVLIMGFFSVSFLISRIAGPLWILIGAALSTKED